MYQAIDEWDDQVTTGVNFLIPGQFLDDWGIAPPFGKPNHFIQKLSFLSEYLVNFWETFILILVYKLNHQTKRVIWMGPRSWGVPQIQSLDHDFVLKATVFGRPPGKETPFDPV